MNAVPNMSGQVCVVTGATSGIGFVAARELARRGASVAAVGRDANRLQDSVRRILEAAPGAAVRGFLADLSLQAEVRRLSGELLGAYPRIHGLLNNAGAMFTKREVTSEGFERTWALNVVTPFLLTRLLFPRLTSSAPSRVVNVASAAHHGARLDFENLQGERRFSGYRAYGRSKLAVLLETYQFARRTTDAGVTVNALHPGFVATHFAQNNKGIVGGATHFLAALFGINPDRGARTSIFLMSDPSVEKVSGKYFVRSQAIASSPASYDTASGERLWDVLSVQTSLPADTVGAGSGT